MSTGGPSVFTKTAGAAYRAMPQAQKESSSERLEILNIRGEGKKIFLRIQKQVIVSYFKSMYLASSADIPSCMFRVKISNQVRYNIVKDEVNWCHIKMHL